jgi:tRNA dimethylallyltransferase
MYCYRLQKYISFVINIASEKNYCYMEGYNMVTILGATASGKTAVAAHLAKRLDGEIISADSRQVYRGMDLGTGKDIADYSIDGISIPFHLIDIVDAGYEYNVFEFQRDFLNAFADIAQRCKFPIVCGGSGMYIEAVLNGYRLINVPINEPLRKELTGKSLDELAQILKSYKLLHNSSDTETIKRAVRAIEIMEHYQTNQPNDLPYPEINSLVVGIQFDRESRRNRITERLRQRLNEGMVEEVERLLDSGIKPEKLIYYGLEYKYLTQYLLGSVSYEEMFAKLETAIHQFSKRQLTWYRKMEKNGTKILWIDGNLPLENKVEHILNVLAR